MSLAFLCSCSGPAMSLDQLLSAAVNAAAEGKFTSCEKLAGRALKIDPDSANALILKAYAVNGLGDKKKAIEIAEKAALADPNNFFIQATYGRLLYENGEYSKAYQPLLKARQLDSGNMNTLVLLAKTTQKLNKTSTVAYYNKLISKVPRFANSPAPWNEIGFYYVKRGNYPAAAKYFRKVWARGSDEPLAALNLAYFLDRWGKLSTARQYYKKFLELANSNPDWQKTCESVRRRISQLPR